MQIGVTANYTADRAILRELRPQWGKQAFSLDDITGHDVTDNVDVAAACEVCENVVVDLRTAWRHEDQVPEDPYAQWCDALAETVEASKHTIKHWEIWGEWACPYVAGSAFGGRNYADLLRRSYDIIKRGDPTSRVWLGGHAVDFGLRSYRGLIEEGCGEYFDVNNLHPFIHRRKGIDGIIDEGFREIRRIEANHLGDATAKPLACTEFGWPSVAKKTGLPLESFVEVAGVPELGYDTADDLFERSFQRFEAWGVQVCIICNLRDTWDQRETNHWGGRIGLLDGDGRPKTYEREDGSTGNILETFVRWLERGRDTEVTL